MLRTRLFLGLLPLLLILVGTGAYAIRVGRDMAGSLSRDLLNNYRALSALQLMRESAVAMSSAVRDVPRGDLLSARRAFEAPRAAFSRELMGQRLSSAGSSRSELVDEIDRAFREWVARAEPVLRTGAAGSRVEQQADEAALLRVLDAIESLTRRDGAAAGQTAARVEELAATTERVLVTAIIGAVLLSLLAAWRLTAALLKPIKALTTSAVAVGEGDLDRTVPEYSRDELGQLARAFNAMAAKLRGYREATLAKVLRTQRTMEATLTSAPDPVFVVSHTGVIEIRNPAATVLGLADFPPELAEPLARVLATGEHYLPADYAKVVPLHGRHYLPRILAIGDKLTEFKGAAIVLQDVTKFRLLDDAKTNLVGTVSHELKTPLTSLRMAAYLLVEQKPAGLTATQRELLDSVRDDADRLLRILDNLLDLTRLEAGVSTLHRREMTVGALLDHAATDVRALIGSRGQTLEVTVAPELAAAAMSVDPERLRHVFANLLTNASKYSRTDGVITLGATAEGGFVRFTVRDHGCGIPAESVGRVFDRFYRAPDQEKSGAGLGLAIAREIVVAHGGSIACTSEPGVGTEFYFLLPQTVAG
jgi:NtrC-family two-component system sensor histidine kinase KinB